MNQLVSDRRAVLLGGLALACSGKLAAARSQASIEGATVVLPQGRIRGETNGATIAFKGIPYAAPPVGRYRFQPPQPPVAWQGVRDGGEWAPAPIQPDPAFGGSVEESLGTAQRSEDCLYVNVFAPDTPGPHPVFVWIHGGGNETGAASQPPFDTGSFANRGIVCVTVGYRVGVLGFLELGGMLGPDWRGSGNNGLKDIAAALRWVRHNIHHFGGDPSRVTLGGESAGAKNVVSLMAAPSTRGLLQRAIVESGGDTTHDIATATALGREAGAWMARRGLPVGALLTLPPAELLILQSELRAIFDRPFPFRAVIDGSFLPQAPLAAARAGAGADVALLIGTNSDESIVFLDRKRVGLPLAQSELTNIDVSAAMAVFDRYRDSYPDLSPLDLRVRFLTAEEYWRPSIELARARIERPRASTYVYRFENKATEGPFKGRSPHVAELGFVWNRLGTPIATAFGQRPTPANQALAREMHERWTAFITTGRPQCAGSVSWPPLSRSGLQARMGNGPTTVTPVDALELSLWEPASKR